MVRLASFDEAERRHLLDLPCPVYPATPFTGPINLAQARIAIVSTAGLQRRSDMPFAIGDSGYRVIPRAIDANDLCMSHISTNFDRTGFQLDTNMVLPLAPLKDLAEKRFIGSVADFHYSFMGATDPQLMEENARQVAEWLKNDQVDAVLLVPV